MNAEDQILFMAELLRLIEELQELVSNHCRLMTSDQDGCMLENTKPNRDVPF